MLAKFIIALISLIAGSTAAAFTFSVREKNFRHIAEMEAESSRHAGYEAGWDSCRESTLIRYLHWQEYQRELKEAIQDIES